MKSLSYFYKFVIIYVFALRILGFNAAKEKLVVPEADPPRAENRQQCGSAAFLIFRGVFSPPQAAKWVRTNSRIEHESKPQNNP
ncbi:MAG: hypothetical protein AAB759_00785 [Patescibacteria group bacterium]